MGAMENVEEILPLSPTQAGMLFETIGGRAPAGVYVAVVTVPLHGSLDPSKFQAAMLSAIQARDAFRACFFWEGVSQPVQLVRKKIKMPYTFLDWSDKSKATLDADIQELVRTERTTGFDLKSAPLMRATLIRINQTSHQLIWTIHHLVSDGWSTGVVIKDILSRYDHSTSSEISTQPAKYRDFLSWLKMRDNSLDKNFWTDYLKGIDHQTSIGLKMSDSRQATVNHQRMEIRLAEELVGKIKSFARQQRVTQVTLLSTAWSLILRRYSGEDTVVFGQTNSGRPSSIAGIEHAAGAFINTLPVRFNIDPEETLSHLLVAAERDANQRRRYEHSALSDVLDCGQLSRGKQVFNTLFVFENFPQTITPNENIIVGEIKTLDSSAYPLTVLVLPEVEWRLEAIYDPQSLSETIVRNMMQDLQALLQQMTKSEEQTIKCLTRKSWQDQIQPAQKATETAFEPITVKICNWASKTPQKPALKDETETLSYREFEEATAHLAARLQAAGLQKGDVIPIALERSVNVIVAMVAVLRAGGAYTPLDLDYPQIRLKQVIEACSAKIIITTKEARKNLPNTETLLMDIDAPNSQPEHFKPVEITPEDLAYVIFTSGSLGVPKGVMISHGNLDYSTVARESIYPDPPEGFLLLSSFAFDSSVVGIYWTLLHGGKLVISPPRSEQDMTGLGRRIKEQGISHILCLPGLYQTLLESVKPDLLSSIRVAIVAGETVPNTVLSTHKNRLPEARLFNEYGPTETTVWCAASQITQWDADTVVPIGHPPFGTTVNIVDADDLSVPGGIVGEISVSGAGVARGYWKDETTTRNAFPQINGTRFYKTGDLGYKLPDGQIVFLGRKDDQVKIRGHRIELSEISSHLHKIENVTDAVALVVRTNKTIRIVGFLATDQKDINVDAVKRELGTKLPGYLIPTTVISLKTLPQLPNGKTDTASLANIAQTATQTTRDEIDEKMTFTESQLAEIWKSVLGIEEIHQDDDFFDLGGDSLKTIAVGLRAEEVGLNIAPHELFDYPKLKDLAQQLHDRAEQRINVKPDANLAHVNDAGTEPIFFMIHGSHAMYSYLSNILGENRPLGFLFSHFLGGQISVKDRIQDIVDDAYIKLKSLQESGPYHIGGYSLGGVLALELANRLRDNGDQIDSLFLLDPSTYVRKPFGSGSETLKQRYQQFFQNTVGTLMMAVVSIKRLMPGADKNREQAAYVGYAYRRILTYYRPPIYEGHTVVLLTTDNRKLLTATGWLDRAIPNSDRYELPFQHLELQSDPDALMAWTSKLSSILKSRKNS